MATKQAKKKSATKRATKKKAEMTFEQRVSTALKEEHKFYEKYGVGRRLIIHFKDKKKTPILGRIGIRLIKFAGGMLDIQFFDLKKADNK